MNLTPDIPKCRGTGCTRSGSIKSERFGGYLCPFHAVYGPEAEAPPPEPQR